MTPRIGIVGGGPGGLAAAITLATAGAEAVVFEAQSYPRHRLCGEFLSPDAGPLLDELGLGDLAERLRAPVLSGLSVSVSDAGRERAVLGVTLPAGGRGVSRLCLDAALAARARAVGVVVHENARVERIDPSESDVRLVATRGPVVCDAAIVATGRAARPRGATEPRRRAGRDWIGVKRHVRGADLPGATELHFVRGAYVGLNEVAVAVGERVVNVCGLVRRAVWDASGASLDAVLEHVARESPALAGRLRSARPVAGSDVVAAAFDFDRRGAVVATSGVPLLVIGDAAAAIVPLAGAGQALALAGGSAAATALVAAWRDSADRRVPWTRVAARTWRRRFACEQRPRLRAGAALQRLLTHPWSGTALVRTAGLLRPLLPALYRATRGPLP